MKMHNIFLIGLAAFSLLFLCFGDPVWSQSASSIGEAKGSTSKPSDNSIKKETIPKPTTGQICDLIAEEAEWNGLPKSYFARLIWKESRFDHLAVSPVGAQGIAQFMPGTAKLVGLKDPFDYQQAIPASAAHLADLHKEFGNWGLAAAAYNAGSKRVRGWLFLGKYLPFETEDFVLVITGENADRFAIRSYKMKEYPLEEGVSFDEACRKLPIVKFRTQPMSDIMHQPWGIQIAGNFRRKVTERSVKRLKRKIPSVLKKHKIYIQYRRSKTGRKRMYAARLGADNRKEANQICRSLRRVGGACVVSRN